MLWLDRAFLLLLPCFFQLNYAVATNLVKEAYERPRSAELPRAAAADTAGKTSHRKMVNFGGKRKILHGVRHGNASANRQLQQFRDPMHETGWTIVAHMDNQNLMFGGNGNLAKGYEHGTFVQDPSASTPDFQRIFPFIAEEIMFKTGDEKFWAITSYSELSNLIENGKADSEPNIDFLVGMNGVVKESRGNVFYSEDNADTPTITMEGSAPKDPANGLVVWGENKYNPSGATALYSFLKKNHGGINVYVRQISPSPMESAIELPIKGITAGPGVSIIDPSLMTDATINPYNWQSLPKASSSDRNTNKYIDLDLGDVYNISRVVIIHYYGDTRQYYSQTVEISVDGSSFTTVYSTGLGIPGPIENAKGNIIDLPSPARGRYIRHRCGRNTRNHGIHFTKVLAFGVQVPTWFHTPIATYSAAVNFCESRNGDLTRLCRLDEICPGLPTVPSIPFGGNMLGPDERFDDNQWAAVSDYENGWVQVGTHSSEATCETHDGMGFGLPDWGTNEGGYVPDYVLCCVDVRPEVGLKVSMNDIEHDLGVAIPYETSYGQNDKIGTVEMIDDGAAIEMSGNTWKAFPIEYNVKRLSALQFTFTLIQMAEFHAICLVVDLSHSNQRCFKISGTQHFANLLEPQTAIGETRTYIINIGAHFTGEVKYLGLIQDMDANRKVGFSVFRDITLFEATRNVGYEKPTTQSSEFEGGSSWKAVDGDTGSNWSDGTMAHTIADLTSPWWEVDLEKEYEIETVVLHNRGDCCSERLTGVRVELIDNSGSTVAYENYADDTTNLESIEFDFGVYASKVKVSLPGSNMPLQLAEVEVFEPIPEHSIFVGCFKDSWDRALPFSIGADVSFEECAKECWIAGYTFFGRQADEQCFCGGLAVNDVAYSKYGATTGCDCDGVNMGSWKNCVYRYNDNENVGSTSYAQVCDNGLKPGDLIVTAFNSDTGFTAKPVVVLSTLKDLYVGNEFFMTDRAINCEDPDGPCVFADLTDSYMDGTVKFTAPETISAGSTIAYSKHKKPYNKQDVYFFVEGNPQYGDHWTEETWSGTKDTNQFHLFSKTKDKDKSKGNVETGDNIVLYCMSGTSPVFLYSLLLTDEPHVGWTTKGDLWGGDLSEGSPYPVTSKRSYRPPYGPALLLNPTTVPNHIPEGGVRCECLSMNEQYPNNNFVCDNGATGRCASNLQCVAEYFKKGKYSTGCGKDLMAPDWEQRNHWRLLAPSCGLPVEEYLDHAVNPMNWVYHKNLRTSSISGNVITASYRFFCEPEIDDRKFLEAEAEQTLKEDEALLEQAYALESFQMDVKVEQTKAAEYHMKNDAFRDRKSKYLPDGKTIIKGNEAPQTQVVDPRVPKCFGNPMCKKTTKGAGGDVSADTESRTTHPLGTDIGIGTF